MTFRWFVILMGIGTALAWIAWLFVIQTMNPVEAGLTAFIFFYFTLFLSLVGTLSMLELIFRVGIRRDAMITREVRVSVRHAMLLALGGSTALWLSSNRALSWYWILLLIICMSVVEYLFLAVQTSRRQ
ncbi:MAG: hypothetical protein PHS79_02610 [Patescibacteria group bacterium]|nr:hypothetical protein [Patescibacteria group bacterium]